jgi:hypothetical protein
MIHSDKDYVDEIRKMFKDRGEDHPVNTLFGTFSVEIENYLTAELGYPFPTKDLKAEEIIDRCLGGQLEQEIEKNGSRIHLAFIPTGPFTRNLLDRLTDDRIRITGLFDNFKTDTYMGLTVRRPETVNASEFHKIIVFSPDGNLQRVLKKQLMESMPEDAHGKIELFGDVQRLDRFYYIVSEMKRKIDTAVRDFEEIVKIRDKDKEAIVIAMKVFPTHYGQIVRELKRRGHAVALIVNNPELGYGSTIGDIAHYADLTYCCHYNYLEFLTLLSKISGDILLTSDHLYDNPLMLMARDLWKGKMYHEIYDLSDNLDLKTGVGQEQFRKNSGYDLQPLDDFCRKALYNSVDGLLYRESPRLAERMKELYNIETPVMRFVPYPSVSDKLSLYSMEDRKSVV